MLISTGDDGRPDGEWRIEPCGAGLFDVRWKGALVLRRVSMDQVAIHLLEHGTDPAGLVAR